jgi:hypothetical protein
MAQIATARSTSGCQIMRLRSMEQDRRAGPAASVWALAGCHVTPVTHPSCPTSSASRLTVYRHPAVTREGIDLQAFA